MESNTHNDRKNQGQDLTFTWKFTKKFNSICFKHIIQKPNRGQLQQLFPSFMAGEYTSRPIEKEMVHIYVMLLLK